MKAIVLTDYGAPDVLQWTEVQMPQPADTEIRVRIRAAGVGPTDVALRAGALKEAIPLPPQAVLGFEAAGNVDAVGASVRGIEPGDAVAALLPHLGGYAQYATSPVWTPKPASVSWVDAAALPASAEAAVGVLRQVGVTTGETLLVLGAGGSVGIIVTQLAVAQGVRAIAAAADRDQDLMRDLGATAITYGGDLLRKVRDHVSSVDAVIDAAGKGGLPQAVELARGSARVVTLSDPSGASIGVSLSEPGPDRAPGALDEVMPLFAEGRLRLRDRRTLPLRRAAEAHELLESAQTHDKLILLVDP